MVILIFSRGRSGVNTYSDFERDPYFVLAVKIRNLRSFTRKSASSADPFYINRCKLSLTQSHGLGV